jgi:hypothetical protein
LPGPIAVAPSPSPRCRQRRTAPASMGGYELVRSDDAAGAAGADLESGSGASKAAGAPPPSPAPSSASASPAARQQRLASLDVFRGLTVLVRPPLLLLLILTHSIWHTSGWILERIGFSLLDRSVASELPLPSLARPLRFPFRARTGRGAIASIDRPTDRPIQATHSLIMRRRRDEGRGVSPTVACPHDRSRPPACRFSSLLFFVPFRTAPAPPALLAFGCNSA